MGPHAPPPLLVVRPLQELLPNTYYILNSPKKSNKEYCSRISTWIEEYLNTKFQKKRDPSNPIYLKLNGNIKKFSNFYPIKLPTYGGRATDIIHFHNGTRAAEPPPPLAENVSYFYGFQPECTEMDNFNKEKRNWLR